MKGILEKPLSRIGSAIMRLLSGSEELPTVSVVTGIVLYYIIHKRTFLPAMNGYQADSLLARRMAMICTGASEITC